MIDNEYVLEGYLQREGESAQKLRNQLIRILGRTGTLPKLPHIQVQYIHSQPEMFLIAPGKQLRIGVRLLEKPVLALVALRYGLEWQLWYDAIHQHGQDYRVCDIAAGWAAMHFINLLPKDDREELEREFPDDLQSLYTTVKNAGGNLDQLQLADFRELNKFHKSEMSSASVDADLIELVKCLAIPTETLMMSGGDSRLTVDNVRLLNKYGCRPFPRPEAFTFASSTATSVSNLTFDVTQGKRAEIIQNAIANGLPQTYATAKEDLVRRLQNVLQLGSTSEVVISPSGTDISLLFAGICQSIFEDKITHILVASDETGSGVPAALAGQHFAANTALGFEVEKGAYVDGFRPVEVVKIPLRHDNGSLRTANELDRVVEEQIQFALASGSQPILHVMDQSKLGYASPSPAFLQKLIAEYGEKLLVLVDNSQLRMDTARIADYMDKGCLMTITGSKYYTGPPFSGALVLPQKVAEKLKATNDLPSGLGQYFLKSEFFTGSNLSAALADGYNIGSFLRWYAALTEMERYYAMPATLRSLGIELFCEHVADRIENSKFLAPILDHAQLEKIPAAAEARSIFPFFILNKGKVLHHEEADRVYRLLNQDISKLVDFEHDIEVRIAKQVCHIGQPVKVVYADGTPSAVVRISLGARVLSESWRDRDVSIFFQRIETQKSQVDISISKIGLILKYAEQLGVFA